MTLQAPVVTKVFDSKDVLIERVLPVPGNIIVTPSTKVVPYDHLGQCLFSQKTLRLPRTFRPRGFKNQDQFYFYGVELGKDSGKKISAPFNGNLHKTQNNAFEYKEETKKYALLSGVWGVVDNVTTSNSVSIKVNTRDLNLVVATRTSFAGELVVFPNPSHLLEKFYLQEFASGAPDGKIVYVGNRISLSMLQEAAKYGVGGVVAGSADAETYKFALKTKISFGLFGGFGDIQTPDEVYTVLNNVSNRYVFFQGERNLLRIPIPPEESVLSLTPSVKGPIVEVKKEMRVIVLQHPYFGKTGVVDKVGGASIFVKFKVNETAVEVHLPNFLVLS
jgi:hypothetical protein